MKCHEREVARRAVALKVSAISPICNIRFDLHCWSCWSLKKKIGAVSIKTLKKHDENTLVTKKTEYNLLSNIVDKKFT